jgi:AcrR family transcriptional regulator
MPKVSESYLAARRQQIIDAALACFDRDGFHGASMQDIFEESGLSAGAVYRYFSAKEDIVEAIAESRHAKEAELINEAMKTSDVRSGLHHLADLYFVWLTDPQEQMRRRIGVQVWAEAVNHKRIREIVLRGADQRILLVEYLRRAQLEGRLKSDFDPEALTRVYLSLFQGFIVQQSLDPDVDVTLYLRALHSIIDSTMPEPECSGS